MCLFFRSLWAYPNINSDTWFGKNILTCILKIYFNNFQHQLWQRVWHVWHIFWDVFAQLFEQKNPEAVPIPRTQKRTDFGRDLRARQEPTKTVLTVTPARARCLSLPRKQMHSNATECYMPYWSMLFIFRCMIHICNPPGHTPSVCIKWLQRAIVCHILW